MTDKPDDFYTRVRENTCLDCGFTKVCTHGEFISHMWMHDELDEILDELGVVQDRLQFDVSFVKDED